MTDTPAPTERWRTLVVILTMAGTVTASIVAGLQVDANIRADAANRDSQYYAIRASGELFRQGTRLDYDVAILSALTKDRQESLALEITGLEQEAEGALGIAASVRARAAIAAARAERTQPLSVFYTDPAYAASEPDGLPNMQAYLDDSFAPANELVAVQNQAADAYHSWSRKGDGYVAVLALLAVALFMFGLAQAASVRTRRTFTVFGALVLGAALVWAISILAGS
jgi:hypothetical protein